jgi:hydrogenase expression/formation protein HypC
MCMAIPSRIIAINGEMATVECFGEQRDVSLMLLSSTVALGDYVLVQAGGFAYERIEFDAAQEALHIFGDVIGQVATA